MIKGEKGQPMYIIDGVEQDMDALGKLHPVILRALT